MFHNHRIVALAILCASIAAACGDPAQDDAPADELPATLADQSVTASTASELAKATGKVVERLGESLLDQVTKAAIGDGTNPVRQTKVIIFNHSDRSLFFAGSHFSSGGFSPNGSSNIGEVNAKSINGYSVESHGFATGVTGASVRFSDMPGDGMTCLQISTSNPYAGKNHSSTSSACDFRVNPPVTSVGNHNEVYVDVFGPE